MPVYPQDNYLDFKATKERDMNSLTFNLSHQAPEFTLEDYGAINTYLFSIRTYNDIIQFIFNKQQLEKLRAKIAYTNQEAKDMEKDINGRI